VRAQQPAQVHRDNVPVGQLHDRLLMLMPRDPNAHRDTVPAGSSFTYEVGVLDTAPVLLNKMEIASLLGRLYPPELHAAKVGGTTVMQFVIAADGTVDPSTIKTISSTDPRFGEASAAAVRQFRFRPGTYKGKNVRVLLQMPVTWQPGGGTGAPAVDPADFSGMGVARIVDAGAPPRDTTKFSYEVARLDTQPTLVNGEEITGLLSRFYPRSLEDTGVGGAVVVQFVVQADGSVDPATLKIISASNPELGMASALVAERFRFQPGLYHGKPVRVLIQMPITWQPQQRGGGANPKGFQELIPPKEPQRTAPDVDTSAPTTDTVPAGSRVGAPRKVYVRDFSGISYEVVDPRPSATDTRTRIMGHVLDRNGQPVAGADVTIAALHRGARSSSDGRFAILVPAGTHRLDVDGPGWPSYATALVSVAAGKMATVEITEPAR
jgi:protein TonB